jgi:hypothetical protein
MDKLLVILLYLYITASQIFALYFLYMWSQTHSFINTFTLGIIVSEFKGILFPFFI